jgi:hypothetical protein
LERTVFEAPPRVKSISFVNAVARLQAEPAKYWVYWAEPSNQLVAFSEKCRFYLTTFPI